MQAQQVKNSLVQSLKAILQNPSCLKLAELTEDPTPDNICLTKEEASDFYRVQALLDKEWSKTASLAEKADKNGVKKAWRKPSVYGHDQGWTPDRKAKTKLMAVMQRDTDLNVTVKRVFGARFKDAPLDYDWFLKNIENPDVLAVLKEHKRSS